MRITQGVAHDVFQRAVQRTRVAEQRPRAGRRGDLQLLAHLFRFETSIVQHVGPQVVGLQLLARQLAFLLPARQRQQIVDHRIQPLRFGFDARQLVAFTMAAAHQRGGQLQARQRRAQLVRDVRDQPLLRVHHALQRADHLVEAGAGGQKLLRAGFQFRMLLQVATRHVIGGVLQLARRFRQAPGQPQQQRGADQHGDDQQQQRPVEHQVDEIGLRAVGGADQVQLVVVFAVAYRERPDQLDAAVLFLLRMI